MLQLPEPPVGKVVLQMPWWWEPYAYMYQHRALVGIAVVALIAIFASVWMLLKWRKRSQLAQPLNPWQELMIALEAFESQLPQTKVTGAEMRASLWSKALALLTRAVFLAVHQPHPAALTPTDLTNGDLTKSLRRSGFDLERFGEFFSKIYKGAYLPPNGWQGLNGHGDDGIEPQDLQQVKAWLLKLKDWHDKEERAQATRV